MTTALMLAAASTAAGCSAVAAQETRTGTGQEVAPVFVFDNGDLERSTTSEAASPSSSQPPQTTPVMQINPDGSVSQSGTITVTTLAPDQLGADLSPLQVEVITWRTFQRKASAGVHGETAEQSQCMVETSIRALPEELLPQLTNPARSETQMSTVELWLAELEAAQATCL